MDTSWLTLRNTWDDEYAGSDKRKLPTDLSYYEVAGDVEELSESNKPRFGRYSRLKHPTSQLRQSGFDSRDLGVGQFGEHWQG
jgi:hypothetical protein